METPAEEQAVEVEASVAPAPVTFSSIIYYTNSSVEPDGIDKGYSVSLKDADSSPYVEIRNIEQPKMVVKINKDKFEDLIAIINILFNQTWETL